MEESSQSSDQSLERYRQRLVELKKKKSKYFKERILDDIPEQEKVVVASLRLLPGPGVQEEKSFEVKTGLNFIGNSEDSSDIRILVYGVSSIHALIEVSPDGKEHFVEDLASTNGTTIGSSFYRLTPFRLYQLSDGKLLNFEPANCSVKDASNIKRGSPSTSSSPVPVNYSLDITPSSHQDINRKENPLETLDIKEIEKNHSVSASLEIDCSISPRSCEDIIKNTIATSKKHNEDPMSSHCRGSDVKRSKRAAEEIVVDNVDVASDDTILEENAQRLSQNVHLGDKSTGVANLDLKETKPRTKRLARHSEVSASSEEETTNRRKSLEENHKFSGNRLPSHLNLTAEGVPACDVKVAFTGFTPSDSDTKTIHLLGGSLCDSWEECTHLVTDRVKRTVKFLCALSSGKYIVHIGWIAACKKENRFMNAEMFIPKDTKSEKIYEFRLSESIRRSRDPTLPKLFEGLEFYSTRSVKPPKNELRQIVEASGGKFLLGLNGINTGTNSRLVIIGCKEDMEEVQRHLELKRKVYSNELVLTGLLRMTVDFSSHLLMPDS